MTIGKAPVARAFQNIERYGSQRDIGIGKTPGDIFADSRIQMLQRKARFTALRAQFHLQVACGQHARHRKAKRTAADMDGAFTKVPSQIDLAGAASNTCPPSIAAHNRAACCRAKPQAAPFKTRPTHFQPVKADIGALPPQGQPASLRPVARDRNDQTVSLTARKRTACADLPCKADSAPGVLDENHFRDGQTAATRTVFRHGKAHNRLSAAALLHLPGDLRHILPTRVK